ncbi:MAG: 16S rRNA (guanine(966)-N(2))-methyltransferase RsmD [Pseudomonadota bacterium]
MRVIGGRARGTRLASLGDGDAKAHLRPTSDRVRENLFNVLEGGRFGRILPEARVLDLFAGTGALGIEALSRGASHTTFVENGRKSLQILSENLAKTQFEAQAEVLKTDATKGLPTKAGPFDLVFLDPPYGKNLGTAALSAAMPVLADAALIVWEEATQMTAPPGTDLLEHRRYGSTEITLLRKAYSV